MTAILMCRLMGLLVVLVLMAGAMTDVDAGEVKIGEDRYGNPTTIDDTVECRTTYFTRDMLPASATYCTAKVNACQQRLYDALVQAEHFVPPLEYVPGDPLWYGPEQWKRAVRREIEAVLQECKPQ